MGQMKTNILLATGLALVLAHAEEPKPADGKEAAAKPEEVSPEMKAALEKLKLPGVKINLDEWCVDVDARVCLDDGLLELIACTKDTKEHESIIEIQAKPSHVHTALLLLGARNGSPAMQQAIDKEMTRFRHIMPSGSPVDVHLVWKEESGQMKERPINEFILKSKGEVIPGEQQEDTKPEMFPTHTFLFAGSMLVPQENGPKVYVCDQSGNVISISTFGDELLCLPGIHEAANEALAWQANGDALPAVDTKVILRLRPHKKAAADAGNPGR